MMSSNSPDWKQGVLDSFKRLNWDLSCIGEAMNEEELKKNLTNQLRWTVKTYNLLGMFGCTEFKTDGKITEVNSQTLDPPFVLEIKKATKSVPYAYWHGLIQGLIYRHLLIRDPKRQADGHLPVLCIVLDWGKARNRFLCCCEISFLCENCRGKEIFFLRIGFGDDYTFFEHNLTSDGQWLKYCY